jgi:hypothetical protein
MAWAIQFVIGFWISQSGCDRGGVSIDGWTLAVTLVAAAAAVGAQAAAIAVYRATKDAGSEPPAGRVHFLATVGLAISPLFLAIILMSGLGVVVLPNCHQA